MKKWLIMVLAVVLLAACSDKEDTDTKSDEKSIGFEMSSGEVEKAENVPEKEGKAILAAFNEYIESFNSKDIVRYIKTLSKDPKGFDLEEDVEYTKENFKIYDIKKITSDVTIIEYDEDEAQIFSNLDTQLTELKTNIKHQDSGRQVTVMIKEDGDWKVTRIAYMSNETQQ